MSPNAGKRLHGLARDERIARQRLIGWRYVPAVAVYCTFSLRTHLFGANRTSFPRNLRDGLADMQGNACYYCGDRLTTRREVDHFLAWSRWPNDAVENLVIADHCNSAKSDHLAAADHLDRWAVRMERHADDLTQLRVVAR